MAKEINSNPTASIIIIGNEILSGRTLDINTKHIAQKLFDTGIKLIETRTIADNENHIINTLLELKDKYDYIFVTGGIGPTHDDITSATVAKAFSRDLVLNQEALARLEKFYQEKQIELNSARKKMAYVPSDSILINNPISAAPGFIVENIYVMAGVPNIMQAMLEEILPKITHGKKIITKSIDVMLGEGVIAENLTKIQSQYSEVTIGSYPFEEEGKHGTSIVLSSTEEMLLLEAYDKLQAICHK